MKSSNRTGLIKINKSTITEDSIMLRQNCALTYEEKPFTDSLNKAHIEPLFCFNFYWLSPIFDFKLLQLDCLGHKINSSKLGSLHLHMNTYFLHRVFHSEVAQTSNITDEYDLRIGPNDQVLDIEKLQCRSTVKHQGWTGDIKTTYSIGSCFPLIPHSAFISVYLNVTGLPVS